ncbi:MAG TPA: prepilin-type N-terminal cleavage/methylation domain-containing protein [Candidatus Limnocylindrales bacterium]|nr:prepilin-type N-terminal cleavage/methylation domain-containing protein [Candidatus Limnocylindrales bacterium]
MKSSGFSRSCLTPHRRSHALPGFSLIELITVIALILILLALLLPAFSRVRLESKVTQCLSNLKHIGTGVALYVQDTHHYPGSLGGTVMAKEFTCRMTDRDLLEEMKRRALYQYIKTAEIFHCPEDRGADYSPDSFNYKSFFYAFGYSYSLNSSPWEFTKHRVQGSLVWQVESWVKEPARYILAYELPARPTWKPMTKDPCIPRDAIKVQYHFHWHFATGKSTVSNLDFGSDRQRFISPILFVDGHSANHDFTRSLRDQPKFPTEATKDWIWYQPLPDVPGQRWSQ